MPTHQRSYRHPEDYQAVGAFLVRTFGQEGGHRNWVQARWEYMHSHPMIEEMAPHFGEFAVWEVSGEIVGFAHCEDKLGVVYVQLDARHPELKGPMLEHAIDHLAGDLKAGRGVYVYLDDADCEFGEIAAELGFEPKNEFAEPTAQFPVPEAFPAITVPKGFLLQSLADDFDIEKVHRVMHRGFDHEGEPPAEDLESRRRKLSSPSLRRDLTIVAVAPDGNYVSFSGMWPVPGSTACYVEPVATDPDYRRKGLGTAVVMEAIRRCSLEGATVAYVGSDQAFYLSMGFKIRRNQTPWWRASRS